MADLYVHLRMKECCRNTLKDLDRRKKKAKFRTGILATPSLHDELGNKPIDEAHKTLPSVGNRPAEATHGDDLKRLASATCRKICEKHAEKHEKAGDATEGRFWREMVMAVVEES